MMILASVLSILPTTGQAILWTRQFGSAAEDRGTGIAVDVSGVYVAGFTGGILPDQFSSGFGDVFVRKYRFDGTVDWTRQFGSELHDGFLGVSVSVHASGVYLAGLVGGTLPDQASSGSEDAFVRKYSFDGGEEWTRQFGTPSGDRASAVSVGDSGVYVVGSTFMGAFPDNINMGADDVFVRNYDLEGDERWTRQFGTSATDLGLGISVDGSGVYVAGVTDGALPDQTSAGSTDVFLRKYRFDGSVEWTHQFGSPDSEHKILAVSSDVSGVYVAGATEGVLPDQISSGGVDAFVRKYRSDGSEEWTRLFGTSGSDRGLGISVDVSGIYVAGATSGTFPGQTTSSPGLDDVFVRSYGFDGEEQWTHQFGSSDNDVALAISPGVSGLYVTGYTDGMMPGQTSSGNRDAFAAKLAAGAAMVGIDIKPGSFPNSISTRSRGAIPVAVLSTPTFDAPSTVDTSSLTFGLTGDEQSLAYCTRSAEDVNMDGILDLVCHFKTQLTGFRLGDTEGVLRGQLRDGTLIEGKDSVRVIL